MVVGQLYSSLNEEGPDPLAGEGLQLPQVNMLAMA
jgi:hypothetical protein